MKIKHKTLTIKQLVKMKPTIRLDPFWQRGDVWNDERQGLLIDSILRSYDIPKIYLRKLKKGAAHKFDAVDGQQRLRAIWKFYSGDLSLPKNAEPIKSHKISNKKINKLPPQLHRHFNNFQIIVSEINATTPTPEVTTLFSRLQMGVSLNPAELRNALLTPLRHSIDNIATTHDFFLDSKILKSRLKHQDFLAHATTLAINNCQSNLKALDLRDCYVETKPKKITEVMSKTYDVLDQLYEINDLANHSIKQKWIFVDLFWLIYSRMSNGYKINAISFASKYKNFEADRRSYTRNPERLIEMNPTAEKKRLYRYIQAFKTGGGEEKNIIERNKSLESYFKSCFRRK